MVPLAEQAFGACTGSWDWVRRGTASDGWASPDVLQAGVEFDAYCSGGTRASYYSAWYEWYPNGEVRLTNLPVAPGDDVFVEVWHTSPTQGYAYLVNYNTNQYLVVSFTAPPGYSLRGNSAELVVERPTVGGSLTTLTNYIMDPFWNAYAYTEASTFYDIDEAFPVDMEDKLRQYHPLPPIPRVGILRHAQLGKRRRLTGRRHFLCGLENRQRPETELNKQSIENIRASVSLGDCSKWCPHGIASAEVIEVKSVLGKGLRSTVACHRSGVSPFGLLCRTIVLVGRVALTPTFLILFGPWVPKEFGLHA